MDNIIWRNLARPQTDGYDTTVILDYASRSSRGEAISSGKGLCRKSKVTAFDGAISIDYFPSSAPGRLVMDRFKNAPLDHENIFKAAEYIRLWEPIFNQIRCLVEAIHPWIDMYAPGNELGGCCRSRMDVRGTIYATVNSPYGLAQSIVHEVAHMKLQHLGLMRESTDKFITNSSEELYNSPIRQDCKRPMTAVFHAQYVLIHISALDICNIHYTHNEEDRHSWLRLLNNNLLKVRNGDHEIKKHLKPDAIGSEFFAGFFEWSDEVIREGDKLLYFS
jgi:hypothetical protein